MKQWMALFVAVALSAPIAAHADTMPASVLIESCNRTDEDAVAVCSAYFMGTLEALAISGGTKYCVSQVTPTILRDRFMALAKATKPAASATAQKIVEAILIAGYTCDSPAH